MVVLPGRGRAAAFDVLEEERAQRRVGNQRQAEDEVGEEPPPPRFTFPGLVFGVDSSLHCHGHLGPRPPTAPPGAGEAMLHRCVQRTQME